MPVASIAVDDSVARQAVPEPSSVPGNRPSQHGIDHLARPLPADRRRGGQDDIRGLPIRHTVRTAITALAPVGPHHVADDARRKAPDDRVLASGGLLVSHAHRAWPLSSLAQLVLAGPPTHEALQFGGLLIGIEGDDRASPEG